MAFNNFPYANLQDLNLDWILAVIKKLQSGEIDTSQIEEAILKADEAYNKAVSAENTANQAASDVANVRQVPSGGSAGDFLRKTATGYAWEAVASAEEVSF